MKRQELMFPRPPELQASAPPEMRGMARDEARLMISTSSGHTHTRFRHLADFLRSGDLLVVNRSATLPASLPASGAPGAFILNLSTSFGRGLWIAEPRWDSASPGPLPLQAGTSIRAAGLDARLIAPYPGLPRLWFVQFQGDVKRAMRQHGKPIRYGYVERDYPLDAYQTMFATVPGSAEMPSAAQPFTPRVVAALRAKGVQIAGIVLHTGVSSLEVEAEHIEDHTLYPEPFQVPLATAQAVNDTRQERRRVIAVGTTVVRALESAWDGSQVRPMTAFTRLYVQPARGAHVVNGLITGLHDPVTSHLAMLYTLASQELIRSAYAEAVEQQYLWHEFGDSHLILADSESINTASENIRTAA